MGCVKSIGKMYIYKCTHYPINSTSIIRFYIYVRLLYCYCTHQREIKRIVDEHLNIRVVDTHFRDTFRTSLIQLSRLLCGLNSCIIFYFILLSMVQAHVTYGGNWGSVVLRVWVGSFQTFCMSWAHVCYQVGKRHW